MNTNKVIKSCLFVCPLFLCAVSTAAIASDDSIQIKQVPYKSVSGNTKLLTLYGGAGVDFSRNVLCKKNEGCTLFGYTNKSFGDSTDFLVIHLGTTCSSCSLAGSI